jgi:hypothetical protein
MQKRTKYGNNDLQMCRITLQNQTYFRRNATYFLYDEIIS